MSDKKVKYQLSFPENLKKEGNVSATEALSFDDLGDFIEERDKIKRILESAQETELKVDYSDFSNHVFFDSAVSKFDIAKKRILNYYPYNGNSEEKDAFELTGSGYESYVFDQWPRHVGYAHFNGSNQRITASDYDNALYLGSSSFTVSAWIRPATSGNFTQPLVSATSGSASNTKWGFDLYLSGAAAGASQFLKFAVHSASTTVAVSCSFSNVLSWNNVAATYDRNSLTCSLYINGRQQVARGVSISPIEHGPLVVTIASASWRDSSSPAFFSFFSGGMDEVRVLHTASALLIEKNYSRPISAEDYVSLYYKFNEGVTETGSIDAVVVDYSKNSIHGSILSYDSSARVSGTVMNLDPGDPILYSFHSSVVSFTSSIALSAAFYDNENNNLIFNLIPEGIIREDDAQEGLLTAFSLGMARFFDENKLYIDQIKNLRLTNYEDVDEAPDLFLPALTRYFGWKVTEHFGEANPLEFFFGENVLSSGSLNIPLVDIRNQFWRRILNNLPYLLKTKGKRNNLDAFFNVLGINKENINIKEYGYLPGGSVEDTRIHKEKVTPLLGIGTGSFSGSYVKIPLLVSGTNTSYTIETIAQLPYISASYSASLTVLTGSIWQFVDPNQVTGSFALMWNVPSVGSTSGKFILTASDGRSFSSSLVEVFDGDFVYVAAGLNASQIPFIEIRTLDNDTIDFSASYIGSTAINGLFTGSKWDFIMGATSGSFFQKKTQGYYGEYRVWSRALSASEITSHAYHFENVGINNPAEFPHPLRGHWPLNENVSADSSGRIYGEIIDMSRNGAIATGSDFLPSAPAYRKFLLEYNYLSPNIDLRWTENKIRIRNKTELKLNDIASDTNEVSLEFNLVDTLNKDISKIFATIDVMNSALGAPVNKYREDYADLEGYRRIYFNRLSDSLHFNQFFGLFTWFDRKISDSIKQLLPARVKFIGGEQVVESHFLERPRYAYKYPIFRTPVDIPNAELSGVIKIDGQAMVSLEGSAMGTYPASILDGKNKYTGIDQPNSCVVPAADTQIRTVSRYDYGADVPDRLVGRTGVFRIKVNGDQKDTVNNPNSGVNFRNEYSRRSLDLLERRNRDGYRSGSFINPKLGNAFVFQDVDSSKDQEHYFAGAKKIVDLYLGASSGTKEDNYNSATGSAYYDPINNITYVTSSLFAGPLAVGGGVVFTASLYDGNNTLLTASEQYPNLLTYYSQATQEIVRNVYEISFELSRSVVGNQPASLTVAFGPGGAGGVVNFLDLTINTTASDDVEPVYSFTTIRQTDGWTKYLFNPQEKRGLSLEVTKTFTLAPSISANKPIFYVLFLDALAPDATLPHVAVFRNFKYKFNEALTNDGVTAYREINNQHNDKITSFINYDVIRRIE